jgi:5'-nucleotidase/UDP-sugar diphosphatase
MTWMPRIALGSRATRRTIAKPAQVRPTRREATVTRSTLVSLAAVIAVILAQGTAFSDEVARLAVPLDGTKNTVAETNLGNFVADAVRAATTADFALVQASILQPTTVSTKILTTEDLRAILIFPDEPVVVLRLDGGRIREALERSLGVLPNPNKGFLQVSGLRVRFDPNQAPGARAREIVVAQTNAALDPKGTYRVAMSESLAKGALGYFRVFNGAPRERTDITLSQALTKFAASHSPLSARVDGRLQLLQQ